MAAELLESLDQLPVRKTLYSEHGDGEYPFPVVLVPGDASQSSGLAGLVAAIQQLKEWLEERLLRSGALLFRGFPVANADEFAQVVEAFGYKSLRYQGGASTRHRVSGPVFTANELPLDIPIGFHNEMAYMAEYPDVIMFFCEIPPPEGGATGIVPGKLVYRQLARDYPEFVQKLEDKGLVYYTILDEREWKATFGTDDRAEAEHKASKLAKKLEWLPDGRVKASQGPYPATKTLGGQHKAWFNNIGSSSPATPNPRLLEFGDGSPLPLDAIKATMQVMNEEQVPIQWKQGDFVVVNNHAVLHSRHAAKPPRRILVSLLQTEVDLTA